MKDILKNLDLYGIRTNFYFMNEEKYRSILGGILSIIYMISILFAFFFFGQDFYYQINPVITFQLLVEDQRELLLNWKSKMKVSIFATEKYQFNKSFSVQSLLETNDNSNSQYNAVNISYKTEFSDWSMSIELDLSNITLFNQFNLYRPFKNIFVDAKKCQKNETNSFGYMCLTDEDQIKNKTDFYILFSFQETFINITNKLNPLTIKTRDLFYKLQSNKDQIYLINLKKVVVLNDLGIITNMNDTKVESSLDSIEKLDWGGENENILGDLSFYIYSGKNTEVYNIKYVKITDVLARIGGLINAMNLILKLVNSIPTQFLRDLEIVNEIFDFSDFQDVNSVLEKESLRTKLKYPGESPKGIDNSFKIEASNFSIQRQFKQFGKQPDSINNCIYLLT